MSDRTAYVYVDLDGNPELVGTLYGRPISGRAC
jgi:hypothetical protein